MTRWFHGTTGPFAEQILAGGFTREQRGSRFKTVGDLTDGLHAAWERTRRRSLALEAAGDLDGAEDVWEQWFYEPNEEALTAIPGAVYAFRSFEPALGFALHRSGVHQADSFCVFEVRGRSPVPDEDWLGCVVFSVMEAPRWGLDELVRQGGYCPIDPDGLRELWSDRDFVRWALRVRKLVPRALWDRIGRHLDRMADVEEPGSAAIATLGKQMIRWIGRTARGRRWLMAGTRWSSSVAFLGPVRPVAVACWSRRPFLKEVGPGTPELRRKEWERSRRRREEILARGFDAYARRL